MGITAIGFLYIAVFIIKRITVYFKMISKMYKVIAILCVISLMTLYLSAEDIDVTACLSLNWVACGISVSTGLYKKYYGTWQESQDISAFGTTCKSQFKGSFYQWKWVWDGKF